MSPSAAGRFAAGNQCHRGPYWPVPLTRPCFVLRLELRINLILQLSLPCNDLASERDLRPGCRGLGSGSPLIALLTRVPAVMALSDIDRSLLQRRLVQAPGVGKTSSIASWAW